MQPIEDDVRPHGPGTLRAARIVMWVQLGLVAVAIVVGVAVAVGDPSLRHAAAGAAAGTARRRRPGLAGIGLLELAALVGLVITAIRLPALSRTVRNWALVIEAFFLLLGLVGLARRSPTAILTVAPAAAVIVLLLMPESKLAYAGQKRLAMGTTNRLDLRDAANVRNGGAQPGWRLPTNLSTQLGGISPPGVGLAGGEGRQEAGDDRRVQAEEAMSEETTRDGPGLAPTQPAPKSPSTTAAARSTKPSAPAGRAAAKASPSRRTTSVRQSSSSRAATPRRAASPKPRPGVEPAD